MFLLGVKGCIVTPKFICWSPRPQHPRMWLYRKMEVFKEVIKLKWGSSGPWSNLTDGLVREGNLDTQRTPEMPAHRWKAVWGHSKKVAICKPRREASGETSSSDTLTLDFWPPELGENKTLLFKSASPLCFVAAALADRHMVNHNNDLSTIK